MAKTKTPSQTPARVTYTARADDLKILGDVEAATDKEALRQARKRFGATSVERRDTDASDTTAPPADQPAAASTTGTKKAAKKGKHDHGTAAPAAPPPEANTPVAAPARRRAGRTEAQPQKLGALDAAALVLAEAGTPLSCQEMITAMAEKGYWSSPTGRTPSATLYSAILRELKTKGTAARFRKTDRGRFAHNPTA
jgi:hypothetical protein